MKLVYVGGPLHGMERIVDEGDGMEHGEVLLTINPVENESHAYEVLNYKQGWWAVSEEHIAKELAIDEFIGKPLEFEENYRLPTIAMLQTLAESMRNGSLKGKWLSTVMDKGIRMTFEFEYSDDLHSAHCSMTEAIDPPPES